MVERTLNSQEDNVFGRVTYEWLPGGLFLQQRIELKMGLSGRHGDDLSWLRSTGCNL